MAGTFTGRVAARGQLTTSLAAIYTVPGSTVAFVKKITFFNTNAAEQTVVLALNSNGADDDIIAQFTLAQNESYEYENLIAEAADVIKASATNNSAVTFTVQSVNET